MQFVDSLRKFIENCLRKTRFHGFYLYRIISEVARGPAQALGDSRLNLQVVTKADGIPDQLLIPKAHGAQGIAEDVQLSGLVLVGFQAGDPAQPYVAHYFAAAPVRLYLDASSEIRVGNGMTPSGQIYIARSTGIPQAIALAPPIISAFQAVLAYAAATEATDATHAAAATTLITAITPLLGAAPAGMQSILTNSE